MSELETLAPELWTATQDLRFLGLEVGARMTVVRLDGGDLFLHSPIEPGPAVVDEVRKLGTVRWLCAPNRFHHLFIAKWRDAFPEARMLVSPGLEKKRPDLADAETLGPGAASPVPGLEVESVQGLPLFNELAWLHPASATLILTDLAFHSGPELPALTRLAFRALGRPPGLGPTLLERVATRDRAALRASLERILAWPFERIVVSHGKPVEHGGREAFRRGYAWVLGAP